MQERPKDLTASAVKVHNANKRKWGWEKPRPKIELLILFQSELYEALEAVRKDKIYIKEDHMSALNFLIRKATTIGQSTKQEVKDYCLRYHNYYSNFVKHSLQDEIADSIIRLLDYAGSRDIELKYDDTKEYIEAKKEYGDFIDILQDLVCATTFLFDMVVNIEEISDLIGYLVRFAEFNDIDIWLHVDMKLFYNLIGPKPQKKF